MPVFVLNQQPSIINNFIAQMRNVDIQQDSMRFRHNLERLGTAMAYEISKTLDYSAAVVETPLGRAEVAVLTQPPVLACILRAALPMYNGFLNVFDDAETAFIGAGRADFKEDHSFSIETGYIASPPLLGKPLIMIDPMLATGKSLVATYTNLLQYGQPQQLHIACAIASAAGVAFVQQALPHANIWVAAVDDELNSHYYIVPGLGDAGDLAFGRKV